MKKTLNIDNPFFAFMGALADVAITNILFVVSSFPIITMGASISAMYRTIQGMRNGNVDSVFRSFYKEFQVSFKKSLPFWVIQLATGAVLFFDMLFVAGGGTGKAIGWQIVGMAVGCMLLLWTMATCYLLPAAVYEGNTVKTAIQKSMYLAVRNLPYTLIMSLLRILPIACFLMGQFFIMAATPIYVAVGFGASAYLNSMLLEKCKGMEMR